MRSSFLAFVVLFVARSSVADVHVVAPSGGDFAQISDAVAASSDGDLILVKSGTYGGFTITNKSLAVVADAGASVTITRQVRVANLAATRDVLLSGFHVHPTILDMEDGLRLVAKAGSVRVQASFFRGADMTGFEPIPISSHGAAVIGCEDVAVTDCIFEGGQHPEYEGSFGIQCVGSELSIDRCEMRGSRGGFDDSIGLGYTSGDGAQFLQSSHAFASASVFRGADGAPVPFGQGGYAGAAILSASGASVYALGCTLIPGINTLPSLPPTPPVRLSGGTFTALTGVRRAMTATAVARETGTVLLDFQGEPGERVDVMLGDEPRFLLRPELGGVALVQRRGARVLALGSLDASGALAVTLSAPELGPGVEARVLHAQAVFTDAQGAVRLGSAAAIVLLDGAF